MGHQLTIAGDEAFALATELASLRGESIDEAVMGALRERIERQRQIQARVDRVLAIAARIRARMPLPLPSTDMAEFYDEDGLPKCPAG